MPEPQMPEQRVPEPVFVLRFLPLQIVDRPPTTQQQWQASVKLWQ
jgi:hypothetical protein